MAGRGIGRGQAQAGRGGRGGRAMIVGLLPYVNPNNPPPPLPPPPPPQPPPQPVEFNHMGTEVGIILNRLEFPYVVIQNIVITNVLHSLNTFQFLQKESIDKLFQRMDELLIHYTILHMSLFRAMVFFYRRMKKINGNVLLQPNQFTIEALSEEIDYLEQKSNYIKNKQLKLNPVKPPEKFSEDTKRRSFKLEFLNYLDSIKGQNGVPLTYIVRPNQRPQGVAEDDIVYSTVHQGPTYSEDNRKVFNILQGFMLGGPGEVFTRPFINSKMDEAHLWLSTRL